ncbi:MAG: efflux RND transporter periplasmic adaptor subunit [Rhodospirillales bacterium]|nr:efflux RND transporter periplasmic adaptor subunit [Rhodospirillales bacterium]
MDKSGHLARRPLIFAFALTLFLALPNAGWAQRGPATSVVVDAVTVSPLEQTVPVIGRLVARQAGIVAARTRGPVAEIRVNVGDRVEKGDVMVVLARDRLSAERDLRAAEVKEAEAAVGTEKAELGFLTQELRRLESLRQSAAFSQARYDDKAQEVIAAKSSIAEAEASLVRAEVNLRLAQIELRDAEILAPYAGVVSVRHTETGSHLAVGDPVVTLIDDLHLEIEADVPASRISGLQPGTEVTFQIDRSAPLGAAVRAVVPDENPLTRTRTVRFTPRFNGNRDLATNQSVTLLLPIGERRDVVTVHKDAVIVRNGRNFVFVVADGTVESRTVRLGEGIGGRFEVIDGLDQGEMTVVRGNERLRPGQKVTARPQS